MIGEVNECIEVVDLKEAVCQILERRGRRQRRKKEITDREEMLKKFHEDEEGSSFVTWDQDLRRRKGLLEKKNKEIKRRMRELTDRAATVENIYRMMVRRDAE